MVKVSREYVEEFLQKYKELSGDNPTRRVEFVGRDQINEAILCRVDVAEKYMRDGRLDIIQKCCEIILEKHPTANIELRYMKEESNVGSA